MRVPNDHPLARTFALLDADLAAVAADTLRGATHVAEVEGLVELLLNPKATAAGCSAVLRGLADDTGPLVSDAVARALDNQHPTIRIAACVEVVRRGLFELAAETLDRLIRADPFWQVRRAAVSRRGPDRGVRGTELDSARTARARVRARWGCSGGP